MPRRDVRLIGRKLGGALRGIFGGLSMGGGAEANPEHANLAQYGELGNSPIDVSIKPFKPSGFDLFGQSTAQANDLNNRVYLQQMLADSNLASAKSLAEFNSSLNIKEASTKLNQEAEHKKAIEDRLLADQATAIKTAASTMSPEEAQMFNIDGPYSNETYARAIGAKFGQRLNTEGMAGIPSALDQQRGQAATAPFMALGDGRYNPMTREYIEGGKTMNQKRTVINEYGNPEEQENTIRFNPTAMTMPRATQGELDMFKGGGVGNPLGTPQVDAPINTPTPPPAQSGIAPPPKSQYVGLLPDAVEGAKKVGGVVKSGVGSAISSTKNNLQSLLPDMAPDFKNTMLGVGQFGSDIGSSIIRKADEPAPQFKENPLDLYLNGIRGGLETMAETPRDIGQGMAEYLWQLMPGYDASKRLAMPGMPQPKEYYDPNNTSLTYPNNMPQTQKKRKKVGQTLSSTKGGF
jgi:hypothetical protein